MKHLLHRLTALLLAVLLLCSAGNVFALAAQSALEDPACVLGTAASDMLAGGGRQVRTDRGLFYLRDGDSAVCSEAAGGAVVLEGPASRLNYGDGVLYFARQREEGSFDLCAFDLDARQERVLLANFFGKLGQLYLVDGQFLFFACENAVWQLELETGDYRLFQYIQGLRSFVPTGCGLIYTVGELFDYELYAGGCLAADHVESYYVDFTETGVKLVYSRHWEDYQMDAAAAFAGRGEPAAFPGYEYTQLAAEDETELSEEEALEIFDAEARRLEQENLELNGDTGLSDPLPALPDPAEADPDDPQLPPELLEELQTETEPTETEAVEAETAEPTETEAVESETTVPTAPEAETVPTAEEPTREEAAAAPQESVELPEIPLEPLPREPISQPEAPTVTGSAWADTPLTEPIQVLPTAVFNDGEIRRSVSTGMQNIVRRARQMLNIQWSPIQGVGGWGYYDSSYSDKIYYRAGVVYTGLPYGQSMTYVPWNASLTDFAAGVRNSNSVMFTSRGGSSRGCQGYGTDCSGFVSWAWGLSRRTLNNNQSGMAQSAISARIGKDYTRIEIGDALIREDSSWSHSRLVTDVTYEADGVTIKTIEVAEANPTTSHNGCCYTSLYTGSSLKNVVSGSYVIYRSHSRNSVSYAHECVVPLEGDVCPICGAGGGQELPNEYMKPGIDVSYAQGTISWRTVAPQVSFAIMRIGYTGSQTAAIGKDSQFENNATGCEDYDVPYGIYFYAGATSPEQAQEEAEAVIEYLGLSSGSGHMPDLPIFYDVEQTNNILTLSNEELLAVVTAFCSTIEDYGLRAGVYASAYIWNTRLVGSAYGQWARWVAHWGSESMGATAGANVWQYSNTGTMAGITTKVDMNYWLGQVGDLEHTSAAAITAPSCTGDGILSCLCKSCGEIQELRIAPLGHLYADGVCLRCGDRLPTSEPGPGQDPDPSGFTDVDEDAWYAEAVQFVVEKGLFKGTSDTTFEPGVTMNRAMLVTVLYRLALLTGDESAQNVVAQDLYSDTDKDAYYGQALTWGSNAGIIQGTGDGRFSPNLDVSREQIATFFYRYMCGEKGMAETTPRALSEFADGDEVSQFAKAAMTWAVDNGILQGSGSGNQRLIRCGANATRAEAAAMFMRLAKLIESMGD